MRAIIKVPDRLFRRAKARAAERGQTLDELMTEAFQEKMACGTTSTVGPGQQPWMSGFGELRHLRRETARIQAAMDAEFEIH
jgi:hypothetical protein